MLTNNRVKKLEAEIEGARRAERRRAKCETVAEMSKDEVPMELSTLKTGKPDWYNLASKMVKRHEGWRAEPYRDTLGNWTFGYGFLMEEVDGHPLYRLTKEEGDALLDLKLRTAFHDAAHLFKGFGLLDPVRASVLVDMAYQMGRHNLGGFTNFREAVGRKDWPAAKYHMLDSKWARKDTPERAEELAEMLLRGE